MAGLRLKRVFAGKFVVLTSEEEQVFGPVPLAEAQAYVADRQGAPQSAASFSPGEREPTRAEEQAWAKKVDEALKKPLSEEEAELRILLLKRRSEDETEYLLRLFKPMLAAGIQGGRRERQRFIRHTHPRQAAA